MASGVWGRKLGMTQVFTEDKVYPATAIDVSDWFVTNIRTVARDGYSALQVGCVRKKYRAQEFSTEWLKNLKKYFEFVREIRQDNPVEGIQVGQPAEFETEWELGSKVDAFSKSRGRGFAGAMKRHNFVGGPKTHGDTMGRRTGSLSWMRAKGRVIKGKRMPGHYGNEQCCMKNLEVLKIEKEARVLLVKGPVPGHAGSLVFLRKA